MDSKATALLQRTFDRSEMHLEESIYYLIWKDVKVQELVLEKACER